MMRSTIALALAASVPQRARARPCETGRDDGAVSPPRPSFEEKMTGILRLEDQRLLRDPPATAAAPDAGPPPAPDLTRPWRTFVRLLSDEEPRIRRRAALAIGHVRLAEGVDPLLPLLGDGNPEVRQMAAFALGLIGDRRARDTLVTALTDMSPIVQASAAEAIGLLGDPAGSSARELLISPHPVRRRHGSPGRRRRRPARNTRRRVSPGRGRARSVEGLRSARGRGARRVGAAARPMVAGGLRSPAPRGQASAAGVDSARARSGTVHARVRRERALGALGDRSRLC